MNKTTYTFIFLMILGNPVLHAQTYISSAIVLNSNWDVAHSPYIVTTDVALFPNVTLTIDPGVTVKFDDYASLDVKGNLIAVGTKNDSITFTSSSASPFEGIWDGLQIENGTGGNAELEYCKGFYAQGCITMLDNGPADTIVTLRKSRFSYNYWGVNNHDGLPTYIIIIDSCKFEFNKAEAIVFGNYMTVSNCIFNNNPCALYSDRSNSVCTNSTFYGGGGTSCFTLCFAGTITGCTITHNKEGIRTWSTTHAYNNLISDNVVGINLVSNIPSGYIVNNTICNNTDYNVVEVFSGATDLSHNCWCTTDSAAIAQSIYDAYDNGTLGIVTFMPFDTVCSPSAVASISSVSHPLTAFPNPFAISTTIQFNLSAPSSVLLDVYDLNGRLIKILLDHKALSSGLHSINFCAEGLEEGVYYYRIVTGDRTEVGKMILAK